MEFSPHTAVADGPHAAQQQGPSDVLTLGFAQTRSTHSSYASPRMTPRELSDDVRGVDDWNDAMNATGTFAGPEGVRGVEARGLLLTGVEYPEEFSGSSVRSPTRRAPRAGQNDSLDAGGGAQPPVPASPPLSASQLHFDTLPVRECPCQHDRGVLSTSWLGGHSHPRQSSSRWTLSTPLVPQPTFDGRSFAEGIRPLDARGVPTRDIEPSAARPVRPAHGRSVSLDHAGFLRAHAPHAATALAPLSSPPPVGALRMRRLHQATGLTIQPVFTLPSPISRAPSAAPRLGPAPLEASPWATSPTRRHAWAYQSESSPVTSTPASAPVGPGPFQQPWPQRRPPSPWAEYFNDYDVDEPSSSTSSAPALPLPLLTPPISPEWSDDLTLPTPPKAKSSRPAHPRQRKSTSSSSKSLASSSKSSSPSATVPKPHRCPYPGCDRAFKRHEHLRRHERMHTQERPFQCEEYGCGLRFRCVLSSGP